jgi:hypothetical protein
VWEHFELFGRIAGMKRAVIKHRGDELLFADSSLNKMARSAALSGGMKRELSCTFAFFTELYIVILDEPACGMDPFARRGMWETRKNWANSHMSQASQYGALLYPSTSSWNEQATPGMTAWGNLSAVNGQAISPAGTDLASSALAFCKPGDLAPGITASRSLTHATSPRANSEGRVGD